MTLQDELVGPCQPPNTGVSAPAPALYDSVSIGHSVSRLPKEEDHLKLAASRKYAYDHYCSEVHQVIQRVLAITMWPA